MADIAISYAHSTREAADELHQALTAQGLTVWMDDAMARSGLQLGIPLGQNHWQLIEHEFARARAVTVVDSLAWRTQPYCQREYQRCRELGKPLVFVDQETPTGGVDRLIGLVQDPDGLLLAHAGLAARAVEPGGADPLFVRLRGRGAADAERVLAAQDQPFQVTDLIREVASRELEAHVVLRRRVRRVSVSILTVLTVLTVAALVLWLVARSWSLEAQADRGSAEARVLALRAELSRDTLEAIDLATQARQASNIEDGAAALASAVRRDARMRVLELAPDDFRGAVWAGGVEVVVAYSRDTVYRIDVATGEVRPVPTDHVVRRGSLAVDETGESVAFLDPTGQLLSLDLGTGLTSIVLAGPHDALVGAADGTVLVAQGPEVFGLEGSEDGQLNPNGLRFRAEAPVRGIDVADDRVTVVTEAGRVTTFELEGDKAVTDRSWQLSDGSLPHTTGTYRATVTDCDEHLYATFVPGIRGEVYKLDPELGPVEEDSIAYQATPPLCARSGQAYLASAVRGTPEAIGSEQRLVLPDDVARVFAARDPRHERIAYLSPAPARLMVLPPESLQTERRVEGVETILPLDGQTIGLTIQGRLTDLDSGQEHGNVAAGLYMSATRGCSALLANRDNWYLISCDAEPRRIGGGQTFRVRATSDGEGFILVHQKGFTAFDLDGAQVASTTFDWLGKDVVTDVDRSSDGQRYVVSTIFGRVYLLPGRESEHELMSGVQAGGGGSLSFVSDGSLVVLGPGGWLQKVSTEGQLIASAQLDRRVEMLTRDGADLIVSSIVEGSLLLDGVTLQVLDNVDGAQLFPRSAPGVDRLTLARFMAAEGGLSHSMIGVLPELNMDGPDDARSKEADDG